MTPSQPALTVVVVIVSDTMTARADASHLMGCLAALAAQKDAPEIEIIVPYHGQTDGIERAAATYPDVRFMLVEGVRDGRAEAVGREHHDVLRARGLAVARGEVVGLLEDYGRADPRWCANVLSAHGEAYAAVGGAMENCIDRPLNWAVYFCDFGKYQPPFAAGEASYASDANVSYKRTALEAIPTVWEASFREVVVNGALMERGQKLALTPAVLIYQHRSDLRLGPALRERFVWGRSYAATRSQLLSGPRRLLLAALSPLLPVVLVARLVQTAASRGGHAGKLVRALPLIAILLVSWSIGEGVGYLTAGRGRPAQG